MDCDVESATALHAENARLRAELRQANDRLEELENTIAAIQGGQVDAVVVDREEVPEIWTLEAAERLHLRLALQAAKAGTWDWDIATGEVLWSDSLLRIFGLPDSSPASLATEKSLIHAEDRQRVHERIEQVLASGDDYYDEFRIVRPDGDVRWLAARGRVIRGSSGSADRLVGVHLDITERWAAEQALRAADRRKNEFIAMLAHELRNPLAAIANAFHLLRAANLTDEERDWMRDMLDRQMHQLGRLIDDLLDVSRITEGKTELRKEAMPLVELVQRTADSMRAQFTKGQLDLRLEFPDGPLWVLADPARLQQIVSNLLTNAVKYTKEGGRVWLTVRREGNAAAIRIKDTGIGIAPEMLPRVFELFAQAEQGLDRSRGGLGIGLTLVRKLVEMHGGSVAATSDGLGHGSEFTVRLPSIDPPASPFPSADKSEVHAATPLRILVVDDNQDAALTLSLLLRASGHETAVAHEGQQALEIAARFEPAVALLDLGLPGMDGFQLARQLRKRFDHLCLVAISGYGQPEDLTRSRAAGFRDHFVKPVKLDELLDMLEAQRDAVHP